METNVLQNYENYLYYHMNGFFNQEFHKWKFYHKLHGNFFNRFFKVSFFLVAMNTETSETHSIFESSTQELGCSGT